MEERKTSYLPDKGRPILRAKPVKGPVDHVALTREFISRYPKILAALAEAERRCAKDKQKQKS